MLEEAMIMKWIVVLPQSFRVPGSLSLVCLPFKWIADISMQALVVHPEYIPASCSEIPGFTVTLTRIKCFLKTPYCNSIELFLMILTFKSFSKGFFTIP